MPDIPNVLSLEGRVAVVTGAGRGIGAATARLLARAGAQVALLDRDAAGVTHTAEQIARRRAARRCRSPTTSPTPSRWSGRSTAWSRSGGGSTSW